MARHVMTTGLALLLFVVGCDSAGLSGSEPDPSHDATVNSDTPGEEPGDQGSRPLPETEPERGTNDGSNDDVVPEAVEQLGVHDYQDASWVVLAANDFQFLTATAFSIGPRLLATNGHVARAIEELFGGPNPNILVVQHETGLRRVVTKVWAHPAYDADSLHPTPDVGVLEVDADLPGVLQLPDDAFAPDLAVLDEVFLCGFPASVTTGMDLLGIMTTGEFHPRASCLSGSISAIRPFDPGESLTRENGGLIQHDISTEPGLSGSAVFNESGELIGIHAVAYSTEGEQNFAIRIDELVELLDTIQDGFPPGTVLSDIVPDHVSSDPECLPICIGEFCDSDCDGWFDRVESDLGADPCDPLDPPFSPSPGLEADVCAPPSAGGGPAVGCTPICSLGACDSDCDGWFDRVEAAWGYDPCNPFSPPFSPGIRATICASYLPLSQGKAIRTDAEQTRFRLTVAQHQTWTLKARDQLSD